MVLGDLRISGDGRCGDEGTDGAGYDGHAREAGVDGLHGENGTVPTNGKNAQTVHVALKRGNNDPLAPTSTSLNLIMTTEKHPDSCLENTFHNPDYKEEFIHDIGKEGTITISACGGQGGRGGSGGNGQGGGHGMDGRNATKEMSGTNGGPGGAGGTAGDGTSGATGGRAGQIKVIVKEEDLDLLLAVKEINVKGGKGGKAGLNGTPGPGGFGGRGGTSYTSRTTTKTTEGGTHEITHHNVGGQSGLGGKTGAPSSANPADGQDGTDGKIEIFVEKPGGQFTGPYDSAYKLEVVDFEIVDENEDGILEFGENIILRNIRVENSGGTPSPSSSEVTMVGESTDWLAARTTTHVVPRSIPNGATVLIDGKFMFRVKRPQDATEGKPFSVNDAFHLKGHMSGIDRPIPRFHVPSKIKLEHPVEMSTPKFLRCLTVGQEAVFSWKIENKSSRDLGAGSSSGRQVKFTITQTGDSALTFGDAKSTSLEIPISVLPAGGNIKVELPVKVPLTARPYKKTDVKVSLLLTPPDRSAPCPIQVYDLPLQVSNTFSHNPEAKVLLVTNFETTSDEMDMWNYLICNRFGSKMDVWNVSVNGHLELLAGSRAAERQTLWQLYKGKMVIMLGNQFPYFDRGQRTAMNLIDPKEFSLAVFGGTSIFASGMSVHQKNPLNLMRLLCTSSYSLSVEFNTIKQLVEAVRVERHEKNFYTTQFVCLPAKKGDNVARCASKANRAASELLRHLPNYRFMISWTTAEQCDKPVTGAGRVEVRPCVPYADSKFILTKPERSRKEEMNEFAILLALPFKTKLDMLWKEFSQESKAKANPPNVLEVIKAEMIRELARLVHAEPPWPDTIERPAILSHIPRVHEFFQHEPGLAFSENSLTPVLELLGDFRLLVDCCPGSAPRKVTVATRRKNLWSEVIQQIDLFIGLHFSHVGLKVAKAQYLKYVADETAKTMNDTPMGKKSKLVHRVLGKVPVNVGQDFVDTSVGVVDFELMGNIVGSQTDSAARKQSDFAAATQLDEDLAHAREQVEHDITRLPGYSV